MSSPRSQRSDTSSNNDDLIFTMEPQEEDDNELSPLSAASQDDAFDQDVKALRRSGFISRSASATNLSTPFHSAHDSNSDEESVAKSFELNSTPHSAHAQPFLSAGLRVSKQSNRRMTPTVASRSRSALFANSTVIDTHSDEADIPLIEATPDHVSIAMPTSSSCTPGSAALDAFIWIVAAATATPTALYAAFGTTNPSDINSAWWNNKTTAGQVLTATYGLSSEAVNTIMSALFLPTAGRGLINGVKTFKQHPGRFVAANIGGLAAAFSSFALAYSPFKPFIGNIGATTFASFNALVAFTQRFVGTESIFKRINNTFFSEESALQKNVLDKLGRLKDEHLADIEKIIADINMTEQDFSPEKQDMVMQKLFGALAKKLDAIQAENGDAIQEAPSSAYVFKYAMLAGDLLFATVMGAAVFCSFGQKGYQAFDNIEQIATHGLGHIFTNLHPGLKVLLSFLPGMISAAFYFINALDLRATATHVATEMHHSYQESRYTDLVRQILTVGCVLALNGLASKSMLGVGASVANNPNNLFGIPPTSTSIGMLYAIANQIAGGAVNIKATLAKTFPVTTPPPLTERFDSNDGHKALKRYLAKFAAYFSDASAHPINNENFSAISRLSLFGGDGVERDRSQLLEDYDIEAPAIKITTSSSIFTPDTYVSTKDSSYISSMSAV